LELLRKAFFNFKIINNNEVQDIFIKRKLLVLQAARNKKRGMVFSGRSAKQHLNSNRGTSFSVLSVPRCYKQDNWSNELVVGQSSVGKNVSTEAVDIVVIRHQATTEDTAD
jgi:hypothetical protein